MKKRRLTLLLSLFVSIMSVAAIPASYYSKLDGKKKDALKTAAHEIVRPHTVLSYNSLFPECFPHTDVYPEKYNGRQRWWDMYSDDMFYVNNGWKGMNREHSFPKSWWGGDENEAYTDLNHLYPSEADANMAKNNYPLGIVDEVTFDNGITKVGYPRQGQGGGAGKVFEPHDDYKGDFARTYFYMATCYQDYSWRYTYMVQQGTYPTLKPWAIDLLLDWARKDPVSKKEMDRNEAVYALQGNRNPFIDFAELAEYIWGTRTSETFYVKEQGGTVTPPITGDPELFAPLDGTTLNFGETAVGSTQSLQMLIRGTNLTSALSIRITGENKNMFTLNGINDNQIPASQINSDKGYKLSITYHPTTEGEHTAAVTLYDGGFATSKSFKLDGLSLPVPVLSTPVATSPTDISDTSYMANWQPTDETIDYYIVNRKQYFAEGTVETELIAEQNYLEIDDRQSNVDESYTVQSVRLGYKSQPSNLIMVAAGGVLVGHINQPLSISMIEGGFRVELNSRHTNMQVCDMQGKIVLRASKIDGGERFELPRGLYIITTDQTTRPLKISIM